LAKPLINKIGSQWLVFGNHFVGSTIFLSEKGKRDFLSVFKGRQGYLGAFTADFVSFW
jgi:hypothetical protein